jgi:hypothetical protein
MESQYVTDVPSHMPELERSTTKPHHQNKTWKQQQEQTMIKIGSNTNVLIES